LIPKKSLKGGEKRNELIEEESGSRVLTRIIIRFKKVCNILETIFDKSKLGNGCEKKR